MAQEGFEDQFRCCICLDIYIDPVSIPCAHNFCQDCIEGYWDTKEMPDCPLCKKTFNVRPQLKVNREFSSVLEFLKRTTQRPEEDVEQVNIMKQISAEEKVPCDVCKSLAAVKSCMVCLASYCTQHVKPHQMDPPLKRHQLIDATSVAFELCKEHNKPLTMYCRQDRTLVCAKCSVRNHNHHKVIPVEKQSRRIKTKVRDMKDSVAQMIQTRKGKIAEIQSSLDVGKKSTESEIMRSQQVCTMLKIAIDKQQSVLVQELEKRQQQAERTAHKLMEELRDEIKQLQARSSEMQHLELNRSPLDILQNFQSLRGLPPTREWSEVPLHSESCMGIVRRGFAKLVDITQGLTNQLSAEEAEMMHQHQVSITFDPETASGWLVLSSDEKQASCQRKKMPRPDSALRFDTCTCVLGKQSFKYGRHCWVVQVGDKTDWDIGVARNSINRKGSIMVRPDSGFWAICRRNSGSLSACASPTVTLQLRDFPQKVGVFLDYEDGTVSFFNPEAGSHIYTFSGCSFTEPLYPYFNLGPEKDGKNATPLVVCPLETSVRNELHIILQSDV